MISPLGKFLLSVFEPREMLTIRTGWGWGAKTALFYAGTNLICNTWCWFRLPETKDRSFGEIDLLFENHISARKFKHTSVDRKLAFAVCHSRYTDQVV